MAVFLYAVKSPESKRQYPRRFKMFLDFLGFDGSLKEQAEEFLRNAKQDPEWIQNSLIQFISYHNDRANRGEISVSTTPNYYRATKLFCEMNDIVLGWKKTVIDGIVHGLLVNCVLPVPEKKGFAIAMCVIQ